MPNETCFIVDSVADRVTKETLNVIRLLPLSDGDLLIAGTDIEPPYQEIKIGGTTVRFKDQDGCGHWLGVVVGENIAHAKEVAKAFLRVLTAAGRI